MKSIYLPLLETLIEQEIEEANSLGSGAVVEPMGQKALDSVHKDFWMGDQNKKVKTDSPNLHEEPHYNPKLLKKMGYDYVGKNKRLGSDTFIQNDDPNKSNSKKIVKAVNKNLNKINKSSLHDPAAVGISLPKKMKE